MSSSLCSCVIDLVTKLIFHGLSICYVHNNSVHLLLMLWWQESDCHKNTSLYACFHSHFRKSGGLSSSPVVSKSTRHHVEEIKLSLCTNSPEDLISRGKSVLANNSLLKGRGLLIHGSTHPPTLSYTRTLRHLLAKDCSVVTLCQSPKTHPSRQHHLVIAQTMCGAVPQGGVAVGVVKLDQEVMTEFESILCLSAESVSLKERREWWGARGKLDKQLKVCMSTLNDVI